MFRGGSITSSPIGSTAFDRTASSPDSENTRLGFRCARDLDNSNDDTLAPPRADSVFYYVDGRDELLQGNYEAAIAEFDRAIEINPDYPEAYMDRGYAYRNLGDFRAAIADFEQTIALDPDAYEAYTERGAANANLGNYEAAFADFEQAIAINPDYAPIYVERGYAHTNLSNYEEAIVDLDRAISLDPNYVEAFNNRGFANANLGNYELAFEDLDRAITLNPNFATAFLNRGYASLLSGDLLDCGQARSDLERYFELMPDDPNNQFFQGELNRMCP